MAKNKKKKNYKLRRRVKRTIAALVMIMAIVVAAIPVENYGTMQAAGGGAWNEGSGNAYSATEKLTNALDDSGYNAGQKRRSGWRRKITPGNQTDCMWSFSQD